jgi:hypothetical protein
MKLKHPSGIDIRYSRQLCPKVELATPLTALP